MSNSVGSGVSVSDAAYWRAFDQLPAIVRERVRNASVDWYLGGIAKLWRAGKHTPKQLIAIIDEADARDTREHFARLRRMVETGVDYRARLTKKALAKWGSK